MASESVLIPEAAIPELRRMLIVGQSALAEIERVAAMIQAAPGLGKDGKKLLTPKHPTGAPEMGEFASALQWLECATAVED